MGNTWNQHAGGRTGPGGHDSREDSLINLRDCEANKETGDEVVGPVMVRRKSFVI